MRKLISTIAILAITLFGNFGFSPAASADNAALVPFLANWVPQPGGYTVILINYDPTFQWIFAPQTGQYYFDGQHQITVTGALGGFPSTLTVTASKSGYATGTSKITGNVIGLPWSYTPNLQLVSQTTTGFTAQVINYDPSKIWQWTSTAGNVTLSSTGLITVSNLNRGQQSIVTVNVSQIGYMTNSASITGSSTAPPLNLTPAVGQVKANSSTATIPVTNFDNYFDWSVTSSVGNASIDKTTGLITVTGLQAQDVSRVTVTDSHNSQVVGQTTFLAYLSPSALTLKAQFGTPTTGLNGFTVNITNYNPNFSWSVSSSAGQASIDSDGLITVTDMQPGQTAELNVTASVPGVQSTDSSVSISNWPAKGLDLTTTAPVPTTTGFDFQISDYNNFYDYQATIDNGQINLNNQGFAMISGLAPGQQAQATVTVSKDGQTINSVQVHSAAILNVQLTAPTPVTSSSNSSTSSTSTTHRTVTSHSSTKSAPTHASPAAPVITLICLKGTSHKFVTAVNPKCPVGYKKQ
jgi:hypothetical protein